jgi:AcrR family transcriptional regulator
MGMKRAEKREHLVDVAARIFNRHGYHAAGIDQVIAEAGIAKTTLYRHFESKEDLIVAVLKRIDEQYRDNMRQAVDNLAKAPKDKLLATFDYLETWFRDKSFYGCPFVNAAAEYSDRRSQVFKEASTHKRLVMTYFEELASAAKLADPRRLANEINLLHEGATAVAHITGDAGEAQKAKVIAKALIGRSKTSGRKAG